MSTVSDIIKKCISLGDEPEWFEYKQGTAVSDADTIGQYISALSNAAVLAGEPEGYMIWGVHNKTHELTGTKFNYQKDINNEPFQHYLSRYVSPAIFFRFDEEMMEGKRVVVLTVPAARIVPTSYKDERYIRIGSSKEKLKKYPDREAALFRVLLEQQNPTGAWETRLSKYHISDINRHVFDSYLKKAREAGRIVVDSDEPQDVLNSIEVADNDVLLNAGVAVFVDCGVNELQMVRFASDERLTIIDTKRYTGSILGLTEKAVLYISDAMDWHPIFDGKVSRREIPEIPVEAIREAVVNAFAHRLIESRQAVDIAIYKSYIEIFSPGIFPQYLEPEEFIRRTIKPPRRNPLITKTLYYSRDMEAVATGFKRINEACTAAGVKYEFLKEEYGFTVRFYRHCGEIWEKDRDQDLSGKGPRKGPEKGPETKSDEMQMRCEAILKAMIADNSISRPKLAEELNLTEKQVRTAIDRLKSDGRIHYEGSGRGGHWVVDEP